MAENVQTKLACSIKATGLVFPHHLAQHVTTGVFNFYKKKKDFSEL